MELRGEIEIKVSQLMYPLSLLYRLVVKLCYSFAFIYQLFAGQRATTDLLS